VKVAFLVNDLALSGGVGVVVQHARQLAQHHGAEVTLVLVREQDVPTWSYDALDGLRVATLEEARTDRFDIALATWWETTFALFSLRAERYATFLQSLEDRFYRPGEPERFAAAMTLDLPVAFVTEARWIAETLSELRPEARVHLVRNGIDKATFPPAAHIEPRVSGPLRILVEGYAGTWFKGVNEAVAAVRMMREPHELTVVAPDRTGLDATGAAAVVGPLTHHEMAEEYAQTDVLLKLSRVEGMFGPPLEAMHGGATCVTTEVTGHDEYIRHGVNALVCDWDDPAGTARLLDLLARDRVLLHRLRLGALETAHRWPDWEQAGQVMAAALHTILREPPPAAHAGARALLADVRAATEEARFLAQERRELAHQAGQLARVKALPGFGRAARAAQAARSPGGRRAVALGRRLLRRPGGR
jgi:glycosyltransferase involved in cell wall biosynthesis